MRNCAREEKYALRYSPRQPNSIWSESHKRRVKKLMREGRMTQAGLDKVAEAKRNGQWNAAEPVAEAGVRPFAGEAMFVGMLPLIQICPNG